MGRYAVDLCAGLTEECCYCVCLDTQNRVTARILLHRGSISSVEIHPRKVAEVAFRTHAASIVLVHNHPGGSLRLSGDDLRATEAMGRALIAVSVGFQDHIVVGGTMMLAEVTFAQPSAEPPSLHSHPHEQVSYVAQGRIVFFLGEESRQLEAGDSVYCPGGVPHGVQPLTAGAVVLDIFHPLREDLLG